MSPTVAVVEEGTIKFQISLGKAFLNTNYIYIYIFICAYIYISERKIRIYFNIYF